MDGDDLDRAAHLRTDAAFLASVRDDPETLLVPTWRGRSLVSDDPRPLIPSVRDAPGLLERADEVVFLGRRDGRAYLLVDQPAGSDPPVVDGGSFQDLFIAGIRMNAADFALLAYARGMAVWHRGHRFDPATGRPTVSTDGGFARRTEDGTKLFPRTDPAVMVLVVDGDRCLLARQPRFPPGMFSALAGFVEPGETLEECVVRETYEEVGLRVANPRYTESQPWPFPRSLMVGFVAEAVDTEVRLDEEELEEARWVTRAEALEPEGFFIPPPFSLAHHLIRGWATER